MGTFTYGIGAAGSDPMPVSTQPQTKAVTAAELRGRGLNVIAATLESAPSSTLAGSHGPEREDALQYTPARSGTSGR